jgi:predicted ATP-grasp superfamily ATP-dependent carboligase
MAFAEFKRDAATGRFVFIEVNGRAVLFNGILGPTGLDLAAMAFADFALGERVAPRLTGWRGAWIHLQADLKCALLHRRTERLGFAALAAPYRGPVTFGDWSASDPKPFVVQAALAVRSLLPFGRRGAGADG